MKEDSNSVIEMEKPREKTVRLITDDRDKGAEQRESKYTEQ